MHGKRRPIQASPVPRCVIDVVDELVARVALRRRILVVLVSDSGVVEAIRLRRCFPASGKKGTASWRLLPPAAISVDGRGSGSQFAQD
jgi:hypothetical protein